MYPWARKSYSRKLDWAVQGILITSIPLYTIFWNSSAIQRLYLALSIEPDGLLHKELKLLFSAAAFMFLKLDKLVLLTVTPELLGAFPPLLTLQFLWG